MFNQRILDSHDIERFVLAQQDDYVQAIAEINSGKKRSHWIWYIFPQLDGLGTSLNCMYYGIKSIDEAKRYLQHPILGTRLHECMVAVLNIQGKSAYEIFGTPDDKKLRSCATLFAYVSSADSVFHQVLDKYFNGKQDTKTIHLLENS
ncbi:calpastatin [Achromatium sp. WMS3]|nr:calpastatin [Achromatium sp. WMS3]